MLNLNKVLSAINKGKGKPTPTPATKKQDKIPVYRGPKEIKTCEGDGCSKIATKEAANLYGVPYDQMNPQDAWYKRAAVIKSGGSEVWNPNSSKMDNVKIGDFVSLDRGVSGKELYKSSIGGYNLKDNEGNEHLGVVVGVDERGKLLVKHGSENGRVYVQTIDSLNLPEYGFKYKPTSIYRSKSIENKEIKNNRNYESEDKYKGISRSTFSGNYVPTKNEVKFVSALNKNAQAQQKALKLTGKEAKLLRDISFGVFQNESEAGSTDTPIGLKMLSSQVAHAFGRKASPSLGDVQFKYDDIRQNADKTITSVGKRMDELNVQKSSMGNYLKHRNNYDDEVNAVMSLLSNNYDKIKKNPEKYQYNPKNNTVYGDIPLSEALLASYNKPSYINSKEKLISKSKYAKNALSKMSKLDEAYRKEGTRAKKPTVMEILKDNSSQSIGDIASTMISLGIL